MSVPAWFWPPNGGTAKTVSAALASFGAVLPDWRADNFNYFITSLGAPISGAATLYPGHSAAAPGVSGDIWAAAYSGPTTHVTSGGTLTQTAMPSGNVYTGIAVSGSAYVVSSSGHLFTSNGVPVGSGLGAAPAWGLVGSSTFYTILAAQSEIGTFTPGSGATSTIALPAALAIPRCMAVNGSTLSVGGTADAVLVSGAAQTAFSLNPVNTSLLLGVGSNVAAIWDIASNNLFTYSTNLSGIGSATDATWVPSGTQALVVNGTSIEVLGYSVGALSSEQTLSSSNASKVVCMSSGVDALVANASSNILTILSATGTTWSIAGALSVTAPKCLAVISDSQVAVGTTGGIQLVNLASGTWTLGAVIGLAFSPLALGTDQQGLLYAVANGELAVVKAGTILGTGTWSGNGNAVVASASQAAIVDSAANEIRVFGSSTGAIWSQKSTIPIPTGFTGAASLGQAILVSGTSSTKIYNFGAPYILNTIQVAAIGFYTGSWTTYVLGTDITPSAAVFDGAGLLHLATVENNLFSITSGGTVTSGIVPQYVGQTQDVSLGTSVLFVSGASMFAGTSTAGVLVQVI